MISRSKKEDIAGVVDGGTPSTENPDNFGGEISEHRWTKQGKLKFFSCGLLLEVKPLIKKH